MIAKSPLCPERVRTIPGSFAFLAHRFFRDGVWCSLSQQELLRDVFLVLVADRHGLSSYSCDKICTLLQRALDDSLIARNALIKKERIAFDGPRFQVLLRPSHPVLQPVRPLHSAEYMAQADPAPLRHILRTSLGANHD